MEHICFPYVSYFFTNIEKCNLLLLLPLELSRCSRTLVMDLGPFVLGAVKSKIEKEIQSSLKFRNKKIGSSRIHTQILQTRDNS